MAQNAPALEMDDPSTLSPSLPSDLGSLSPSSSSVPENEKEIDGTQEWTDEKLESSAPSPSESGDLHMPRVPFDDARRIMTRTDFLEPLDHLHVGLISPISLSFHFPFLLTASLS